MAGDDVEARIKRALKVLGSRRVLVGIPDATAERQPEPGEKATASNAVIGYVQEFGDDEKNIPARPFLVPGVQDAKEQIVAQLKFGCARALAGDIESVDKTLAAVGLIAQNAVQAKITDGPFTPLSPKTLQQRRARGRTGEKPLIDTGQLRRSVTYVVRGR